MAKKKSSSSKKGSPLVLVGVILALLAILLSVISLQKSKTLESDAARRIRPCKSGEICRKTDKVAGGADDEYQLCRCHSGKSCSKIVTDSSYLREYKCATPKDK